MASKYTIPAVMALIGLALGGIFGRKQIAKTLGLPVPGTVATPGTTGTVSSLGNATPHELALSRRTGLTVATLRAIAKVESGGGTRQHPANAGRGSGNPVKPKVIRFEPHAFLRNTRTSSSGTWADQRETSPHYGKIAYTPSGRTGYTANSFVPSETGWPALMAAFALNRSEAIRATSWGRYQIMGGWFKNTLASDPAAFIQRWVNADLNEVEDLSDEMLVEWIMGNPSALAAAKRQDWRAFSVAYNGSAVYESAFFAAYAEAEQQGAPTSMVA